MMLEVSRACTVSAQPSRMAQESTLVPVTFFLDPSQPSLSVPCSLLRDMCASCSVRTR
jgi:hypothetical protein